MTQHYYPLHYADELQSHFSKLPTLATNCAIVLKEAKTNTVQTYRRHLVPSSSETFSHFTPRLFLLLLFLKGAHVLVLWGGRNEYCITKCITDYGFQVGCLDSSAKWAVSAWILKRYWSIYNVLLFTCHFFDSPFGNAREFSAASYSEIIDFLNKDKR